MGPANKVHVVFVEELCDHVGAKSEGDATVVLTPAKHIFIWVSPQQVAQQALVGHISGPHDPTDLLHRLEVWWQAWKCSENSKTFYMNLYLMFVRIHKYFYCNESYVPNF